MAYVTRVLLEGETIEARPHLSRMAIFGAPTVEFLALMAMWAIAKALVAPYLTPDDPALQRWAGLVAAALAALVAGRFIVRLALRAIAVAFTEIAVSSRRFMEKTGVLNIRFYSTDLEKVVRVAIEQSLLGRLFNYGDVTIVTVGEVSHTTRDVADPIRLQQALHRRMTTEPAAPPAPADAPALRAASDAGETEPLGPVAEPGALVRRPGEV